MVEKVSAALIGLGSMARFHLSEILKQTQSTQIEVVCDLSREAYQKTQKIFRQSGLRPPENQPDFEKLLEQFSDRLDAVFIITPHADHHNQTKAAMEASLDVLLEKPMVMNTQEAESLIETRDRTGRLLVVAFQGSLSPQIRHAVSLYKSGKLGRLQSINALVWQNWGELTEDTWRQDPKESGGGFLFDTGAHMLNTVVDLAGEDFIEVAAWLENNGRPVETRAVINGRLASGALVSLHASGETIPSCASDIYAFYSNAILHTGIWGEHLEIQFTGDSEFNTIPVPDSLGVWEQFLAVLRDNKPNPSPPEIGLRMAYLYEAIRISAENKGTPYIIPQGKLRIN
jgi:predicted dehydrogenase